MLPATGASSVVVAVSITPGATAFTLIPSAPNSAASARVRFDTAPFEAQ
jgi:hypothetical protein